LGILPKPGILLYSLYPGRVLMSRLPAYIPTRKQIREAAERELRKRKPPKKQGYVPPPLAGIREYRRFFDRVEGIVFERK
jgi:hypothetical protein